jgi:peroxiredoxin
LVLASGLLGISLSVLILGASRGQATNAGLPGSNAADFSLRDSSGKIHGLAEYRRSPLVLIVAQHDGRSTAVADRELKQVHQTFANDTDVKVLGIQVADDAGLLTASVNTPGILETRCPQLPLLKDIDGSTARAYRVMDAPTAFVIDEAGVIRARVPLDHDGAAVSVAGTVSSLRPVKSDVLGLTTTH